MVHYCGDLVPYWAGLCGPENELSHHIPELEPPIGQAVYIISLIYRYTNQDRFSPDPASSALFDI